MPRRSIKGFLSPRQGCLPSEMRDKILKYVVSFWVAWFRQERMNQICSLACDQFRGFFSSSYMSSWCNSFPVVCLQGNFIHRSMCETDM